ncbi:MAG: WG repeat-containing protein [Bacteroidota bacterium]
MKHFFAFAFVIAFVAGFAQSTEISSKYDKIGKFNNGYAVVSKGRQVGVINTEGKEIVKPEYEHISGFGKDGKVFTRKNGLVGVIDNTGKVVIDNKYDYISHFKGDNAVVRKDGLCGVINKTGKVIVDMKYEKLKVEDGGIIKAINPDKTEVLIKPNN